MDSTKWNPHQKIWEVIEHFNHLESVISHKLSEYLWISDEHKIKVIFNNSIIHFWGKIKLLANFRLYDKIVLDKLRELSNIRNGFAHTFLISQNWKLGYKDWILDEVDVIRTIEVMNSQWIIEEKDLDKMYERYFLLYEEIFTLTQD